MWIPPSAISPGASNLPWGVPSFKFVPGTPTRPPYTPPVFFDFAFLSFFRGFLPRDDHLPLEVDTLVFFLFLPDGCEYFLPFLTGRNFFSSTQMFLKFTRSGIGRFPPQRGISPPPFFFLAGQDLPASTRCVKTPCRTRQSQVTAFFSPGDFGFTLHKELAVNDASLIFGGSPLGKGWTFFFPRLRH